MCVEPGEDGAAELRRVAVGREVFDEVEFVARAEGRVLMADAVSGVAVAVGPPEDVFRAGGDKERAGSDERAEVGPAPTIVVDPEGTVAVAVGGAIGHDVLDAARLADGNDAFHSLVG